MSTRRTPALLLALAVLIGLLPAAATAATVPEEEPDLPHIWVYSETLNFRHGSIDHAKGVLADLVTASEAYTVEFSEDHTDLTPELLARTDIALFLSPSGIKDPDAEVAYVNQERAPFTAEQRALFQGWVACGGGFVAVHQAMDSYDDWPEWDELVGAKFLHHPFWYGPTEAELGVVATHPATEAWAGQESFLLADEFYAWKPGEGPAELTTDFTPLVTMRRYTDPLMELTWGSTFAEEQPLAWTSSFRGQNRSFSTNLGHDAATWDREDFQSHLMGGIGWVAEHRPDAACVAAGGPANPPGPRPQPGPAAAATTAIVAPFAAVSIGYVPTQMVVGQGGSVEFVNLDNVGHNVTSRAIDENRRPIFRSATILGPGETAPVDGIAPLPAGEYDFYCSLHPAMEGVLTVL